MSLRTSLLPVFQDARQLVEGLGLRTCRVIVRVRTWSGGKVRLGTPTDLDTEILPRPRVRETDYRHIRVDKITPSHSAGGYTREQLRPDDVPGTEYYYVVVSPDGVSRNYALENIDTARNFGYELKLIQLDRSAPTW